jgi:hypothetical protein
MTRTRLNIVVLLVCAALPMMPATAQEQPLTRSEVLTMLAERDAIIIELQQQVRSLREQMAALDDGPAAPVPDANRQQDPLPAPDAETGQDSLSLVVDESAVERALDRTLVQSGALLLPRSSFEFVPTLSRNETELDFVTNTDTGAGNVTFTNDFRRTRTEVDFLFRIGLAADSQFESGVPYVSVDQDQTIGSDGIPIEQTSESASGAGDVRIGFAKTLLRESGRRPDLVGRLTYGTGSGDRVKDGVNFGGGFEYVTGSLTLLKRRDPLALVFSAGYTSFQSQDGIDPGAAFQTSFGTALAVSPDSSLSASLNYTAFDETTIDGQELPGSDINVTTLNLALSTILRRGKLLNVYTELGLSEDAPDYSLGLSVPMRW